MILLDNVSVDTTSGPYVSKGGKAVAIIRGDNYGGGEVLIQAASASDPGERYSTLVNGTLSGDAMVLLDYIPVGVFIRALLSESSGASNVFVEILQ